MKNRSEQNESLIVTKKILTLEEAVMLTGLSKSYMYKLTSKREIPHFKPRAKLVYFVREELEAWLLQNRIKTNAEIEHEAATYVTTGRKGGR